MEIIYEIKNLDYAYNQVEIIKDISFTIHKGDSVAIIGGNGAGKSTLVKLLVNELEDKNDAIRIYGQKINQFKDWDKIGYVAQLDRGGDISFPISVREMVFLNLYTKFKEKKITKKQGELMVKNSLELVNAVDFIDKDFNKLSGGQKQRVLIAKSLVNNPQLLIFDEPTVGIDKKSKENFYNLLLHLNKKHNITLIMVTHDLDNTRGYFNKVKLIKNGKMEDENVGL